jgi:hypothetical protein
MCQCRARYCNYLSNVKKSGTRKSITSRIRTCKFNVACDMAQYLWTGVPDVWEDSSTIVFQGQKCKTAAWPSATTRQTTPCVTPRGFVSSQTQLWEPQISLRIRYSKRFLIATWSTELPKGCFLKIRIFRKLVMRHWRQVPLFLVILKTNCFNEKN